MKYVNRLKEVENKLSEIGHVLNVEEKHRTLLRGITDEVAVTAAVIRGTDKRLTEAIAQLFVYEATIAEDISHSSESHGTKALATTREGDSCTHCGRPGHVKDTCYHNPAGKNYRSVKREIASCSWTTSWTETNLLTKHLSRIVYKRLGKTLYKARINGMLTRGPPHICATTVTCSTLSTRASRYYLFQLGLENLLLSLEWGGSGATL